MPPRPGSGARGCKFMASGLCPAPVRSSRTMSGRAVLGTRCGCSVRRRRSVAACLAWCVRSGCLRKAGRSKLQRLGSAQTAVVGNKRVMADPMTANAILSPQRALPRGYPQSHRVKIPHHAGHGRWSVVAMRAGRATPWRAPAVTKPERSLWPPKSASSLARRARFCTISATDLDERPGPIVVRPAPGRYVRQQADG